MPHSFYRSKSYKQKQGLITSAAWKRGVFDFIKKREKRTCKRKDCLNSFVVIPSNPKKFCSQTCAAIVNNKLTIKRTRFPRGNCLNCGKEVPRCDYKYCCNICQMAYQHNSYIKRWKTGGIQGLSILGTVSPQIKRYLREKYGNKCCLCGWSKVNPKTGKAPLVADHIDGNWQNNKEENLRLLCPNCDSLTPTYGSLNKGRGRKNRMPSKRNLLGKS